MLYYSIKLFMRCKVRQKLLKRLSIIFVSVIISACINLNFFSSKFEKMNIEKREQEITKAYSNLSDDFFLLLEDEINEEDRKKLEDKFKNLKMEIGAIGKVKTEEHQKFLNKKLKEINLKIQYLEDLKRL